MSAIATRFGAESTAAEAIAGIDLTGKRAIVTGASSGIGVETARALAGAGAEVTLAVRDTAAGERTAADIDGDTRVERLDLSDLGSVRAFAVRWDGPLEMIQAEYAKRLEEWEAWNDLSVRAHGGALR